MSTISGTDQERGLARLAQRSAAWTEKWFPDAYVFALAGVVLVSVAAMANGSSPAHVAETFGGGFWDRGNVDERADERRADVPEEEA